MLKFFKLIYRCFRCIRECIINLFFILFILIGFTFITFFNNSNTHLQQKDDAFSEGALLLQLNGYLADNREEYSDFYRLLDDKEPQKISVFDIANAILTAKNDEKITGLILDLGKLHQADFSSLDYLGNWITRFKESGKPVIAIGQAYSQKQYYLASFADEIYLNPTGFVGLQGINYTNIYFKALLDKIEAVPHIFRVGTYKSAVEPLIRNDMSKKARENNTLLVNQLWQETQQRIASNRGISTSDVLPDREHFITLLKKAKGDEALYALNQKLVTKLVTEQEINTLLINKFGKNSHNEFKHIHFEDYSAYLNDRFDLGNRPKIAVVNVEGEITLGESDGSSAGSTSIVNALRNAYRDPQVEGIILRVNSPGGSAMASELIRQEISYIQQSGKPVVVSMGAMAASGGYWISATANKIVASPQTITGSIGIFGLFVNFEKTAKNMGVNEDGISTSPLAEMSVLKPLNSTQTEALQMSIEHGYDKFLDLVSEGRQMSKTQVDKIAQGQVWSGKKAKELGLVDALGDFETAFNIISELVDKKRLDEGKPTEDYVAQWFTDEENTSLKSMLSKFKLSANIHLTPWMNLPLWQKAVQPVDLLSKFNDPKNTYLYCLTCGKLE